MSVQTFVGTLVMEDCYKCHVLFGLESNHRAQLLEVGGTFYCPNGHSMHYVETTAKKLERALQSRDYYEGRLAQEQKEHDATTRRLRATRGVVTKTKRRIAHGVCPCCTRTFQNLARHMANQHPNYEKQPA